jgi:hypothetical protein
MFSLTFHKHPSKEDKDDGKKKNSHRDQGMLTFEQGWNELLNDCKNNLCDIGIPVQSKEQTEKLDNQFRFVLRSVANDLLG